MVFGKPRDIEWSIVMRARRSSSATDSAYRIFLKHPFMDSDVSPE
jgi:hypothetical protein